MNLRTFRAAAFLAPCVLLFLCAPNVQGQGATGDLKITFKLKGDIPTLKPIDPTTDKAFCGKKDIVDERLIVDKESKGIKNVVVFIKVGRRGPKLPKEKGRKIVTLDLNNKACAFEPHVVLARVGDTVKVNNPDQVGHNSNFGGFVHDENFTIPAGQNKTMPLTGPEPTLIPVSCNIHPWMKAHMLVVDHKYAAISNEKGELTIKDIPVGKEFEFQVWHECGTFKNEIYVDGKKDKWSKNRLEMKIKAGMNDLGIVEVPVKEFEL